MATPTKQIRNTIRRIVGTALLGISAFAPMARATPITSDLEGRARVEYNETGERSEIKTTLAGTHECNEFARVYNHEGDLGDYTSAAVNYNGITAFGTAGDLEGLGLEAAKTFGNTKLIVNGEHAGKNEDKIRLGASLDQKFRKLTLGLAYDKVKDEKAGTEIDYPLAHAIVDFKEDQYGIGARRNNETLDNSVTAFHCHYGKNEKFGDRTWVQYNSNETNDASTVIFDTILAQNPTFGSLSSPWIVGRGRGDMYDSGIVEDALSPERVPLGLRTKGGFVSELKVCAIENEGYTGNVRADVGYKFNMPKIPLLPSAATIIGIGQYDIAGTGNNRVGASIMLQKGNFCLEGTVVRNLSETARTQEDAYVSIGYSKQFCGAIKK